MPQTTTRHTILWFGNLCLVIGIWSPTHSIAVADDAQSDISLEPQMQHLRIAGPREWTEFPEVPDGAQFAHTFAAQANASAFYLKLRHQDVKQTWNITLNGRAIGNLKIDENDMIEYFQIPPNTLRDGDNQLLIQQEATRTPVPDDIRIGEISIGTRERRAALNESHLRVSVKDELGQLLPARITICDNSGALKTTGGESNEQLAVRPGIVYTSTGLAEFSVPSGKYSLVAGRGFEYSIDRASLTLEVGQTKSLDFRLRRVVNTQGYVACDTHVHTLTHSGHGDATVEERMITLAGEGIELPIATDHNRHIDHRPFAQQMSVSQYFTPVIGNEVTTKVGHFNSWPVAEGAEVPNHNLENWPAIFDEIYRVPGARIAILNHARDLHSGVIPFGPTRYLSLVAANLNGWPIRFNAMEIVNSSATQNDILQLSHDWMSLLNAGYAITPVGASDSHDVGRHFVGQARTYIRCDDVDPGAIDIDRATDAFLHGEVMVSYGLLCQLSVNHEYGSGGFVPPTGEEVAVSVRVASPGWNQASLLNLYANGKLIRTQELTGNQNTPEDDGMQQVIEWSLQLPKHDIHLVAIALGPGIDGAYWKTAKPYQPTSSDWQPHTLGCSGAVWIDADRDGRRTSAADYARQIVAAAGHDLQKSLELSAPYDEAVAAHVAHLQRLAGVEILSDASRARVAEASEHVRDGFQQYQLAWRNSQLQSLK